MPLVRLLLCQALCIYNLSSIIITVKLAKVSQRCHNEGAEAQRPNDPPHSWSLKKE